MKAVRFGFLFIALLFLAACVTINIYFPAAQAQEAAEKIVEDILGDQVKRPEGETKETPEGDKGSSIRNAPAYIARIAGLALDFIVPAAHAAQPDFSVDTPEIRRLQASMKSRHGSLAPYYNSGAIGFTNNALVAMHDANAVSLKDRARLNKLVQAENADRNRLYQAIARANGHPEWEADVREVFAGTWIDKAGRGWWYQNRAGKWVRK